LLGFKEHFLPETIMWVGQICWPSNSLSAKWKLGGTIPKCRH